jgi:hypothetical protein
MYSISWTIAGAIPKVLAIRFGSSGSSFVISTPRLRPTLPIAQTSPSRSNSAAINRFSGIASSASSSSRRNA